MRTEAGIKQELERLILIVRNPASPEIRMQAAVAADALRWVLGERAILNPSKLVVMP